MIRSNISWLTYGTALLVLIGLSSAILGVHWSTDLLGGDIIGFL